MMNSNNISQKITICHTLVNHVLMGSVDFVIDIQLIPKSEI